MRRLFVVGLGALVASACDPLPPTGNLVLQISGLPAGAPALVRVSSPPLANVAFSETVGATKTLLLNPGTYIVRIDTVHASALYVGPIFLDTISIARGKSITITAAYHLASGSVAIAANGFPLGQTAPVTLQGSTGQVKYVNAPATVTELPPGVYTLTADTTPTVLGDLYGPDTRVQQITVPVSLNPVTATINYALTSATLNVNVSGLPNSGTGVTITGPNNYKNTTPIATSLHGLKAGTYTVSAPNINATCPNIFTASNAPQPLVVARNLGATATEQIDVAYSQIVAPPAWLNLKIENAYLTQVTQNWSGTVPMLTGRSALLRVFVTANQCNTENPKVRVTLNSGAVYDTVGSEASVRNVPVEGTLLSSWNFVIPANEVKSGLTFTAKVDPANAITESDKTDNTFPATGSKAVATRTAPVVGLRLIPVSQSQTGLAAVITPDTAALLMDWPRRIHPVGTYDVDIHDVYTTGRPVLQSQDQNGSWSGILGEIKALKVAEGSTRFYYGVVKVTYTSGVAGLGYVSSNPDFRAAIGWSYTSQTPSSNSASYVLAHELGHNFGRLHSPCGGPSGVDQLYPYQGGSIGSMGYDATDGSLKAPDTYADIMAYCNPRWISDYTYMGMMDNLSAGAASLPMTESAGAEPGLLVWGRIVNGQPILEPAFEVTAPSVIPESGPYRIAALADDGAQLFSYSFSAARIADLPYEAETFAFVVPKTALRGRALGQLRLTARGRTVASARSIDVTADPGVQVTRTGTRAVRLQWDANRFPVVMVRDPRNGQVLSFARGGDAAIVTASDSLEVSFSNRVGSAKRVIRAR